MQPDRLVCRQPQLNSRQLGALALRLGCGEPLRGRLATPAERQAERQATRRERTTG